jgi:hypothetical protein
MAALDVKSIAAAIRARDVRVEFECIGRSLEENGYRYGAD